MLDDEPNDQTTPATDAPVKTVRRRRATKAAAAPAAETAVPTPEPEGGVSAAGETPGYSQDGGPADVAEAAAAEAPVAEAPAGEAPAAPAKRVRKAPAKKAAPRKRAAKAVAAAELDPADAPVAEALAATGEPVVEAVEDDPAVVESSRDDAVPEALVQIPEDLVQILEDAPTEDVPTGVLAPAAEQPAAEQPLAEVLAAPEPPARTRRRRASAIVTFQAPDPVAAPLDDEVDEPVEAPAPRRRRRAGTTGALSPSELVPTLLAPEPVAEPDEDAPEEIEDAGPEGEDEGDRPRRRRRGRRGRGPRREDGDETATDEPEAGPADEAEPEVASEENEESELNADGTRRRRRRRRRSGGAGGDADEVADDVPTVVHVREPRAARVRGASAADEDGVRGITGSTRMAAKRARRQEGRDSGRRRPPVLSEAEFLARREAVDRTMVVRQQGDRTQIAVLEDGVLVEHYVTKASTQSYAGNVYLGKVQNVLPSMEAAFVDIGKGKNGVLYAGEVNYDAQLAGNGPRKIEQVLKSGQDVLVQVSKDPIGHKGARLTSQVSLPGRYLVYVPEGTMTGISRKLPDTERSRLKAILKKIVPDDAGVIIRTAAEGASEEELTADVRRLQAQWEVISRKVEQGGGPVLLHAEPDLVIRVVRDVFNEDFTSMVVQGDSEWDTIKEYVDFVAPDLAPRLSRHEGDVDVFAAHRIDEQLAKALDRKVWLPSGGSLVIDRTEAMVVIDVNTGKYVGKGGNLEETVTRNNLEAAEEIARQLRLRDLGGIIVVDFIDMVLESNRDLVVRRLVECLGRDRTKHQVAEVTSLGLVQMTRKRVGQGLLESFSETCDACGGRGVLVHAAQPDSRPSAPRDPRKAAAAAALVAKASGHGVSAAAPAEPPAAQDEAPPAPAAVASDEPEREAGPSRGRRRRGGRGAGAAAARAATAADAGADAGTTDVDATQGGAGTTEPTQAPVDDAPLAPEVQDLADIAPDLVPELADQPVAAQEDLAVLPPEITTVLDPAPEQAPSDAEPVDAEPVDAQSVDAQSVDAQPVDVELEPEPESAPELVELQEPVGTAEAALVPGLTAGAETSPPPRRRRRATSRPAGPPTPA